MIATLLVLLQQVLPHGPEPGPRAVVAGMTGFQTVSKIDFGERQNRLTAAYVFPDRVRWHFENYSAVQRSEHQYFYREGEHLRAFEGGASRELLDEERTGLLLQMELRRAAMLWPDGFDWQDTAKNARSAPVFADSCCREGPLGSLIATTIDGRPTRIEARDALGKTIEALGIRAWQVVGDRTWPRTLELQSDHGSFMETVESVDTRIHFLELSFLPPDRRPMVSSGAGPSVQSREIVSMTYSARPLPPGTTWDEAKSRASEWLAVAAEEMRRLGLTVDPVPTFELSSEGRPTRCLLRLSGPVLPPPDGYETQPERVGVFLILTDLKTLGAPVLAQLANAAPKDSRPGVPYVRIRSGEAPIEVVLPLGQDH